MAINGPIIISFITASAVHRAPPHKLIPNKRSPAGATCDLNRDGGGTRLDFSHQPTCQLSSSANPAVQCGDSAETAGVFRYH